MSAQGWLQIVVIFAAVLAAAIPLGAFMARVLEGERTLLSPVLGPVEGGFYRLAGVDPGKEQSWLGYGLAMLAFNAGGLRAALRASCACRACCRSTRRASTAWRRTSPSTPRSASSPTPTGRPMAARRR